MYKDLLIWKHYKCIGLPIDGKSANKYHIYTCSPKYDRCETTCRFGVEVDFDKLSVGSIILWDETDV